MFKKLPVPTGGAVFSVFLLFCLLLPLPAAAAEAEQAAEKACLPGPTLLIYFENDLFYNEDRYYTNAVQMRLISREMNSLRESWLPEGLAGLLESAPILREAGHYNISGGIGQQIYTPADTDAKRLLKDDRPYAGYLYGFFGLHAKQPDQLDNFEIALGIIGPSALGEQAQNEVHRIRDIDRAEGWDNQLKDEPALMLTWSRIWRLNDKGGGGFGWDVLPRVGLSAGTPITGAGLGGEVRFGWNLPDDFGTSIIRAGSGINVPTSDDMPRTRRDSLADNISLYLFAGADGGAIAYNSFLDGNLWKNSHNVDKFPLVGELNGGIVLRVYDFQISYTHVLRSKEFHGQEKYQNYGSITVGYTF